VQEKREKVEGTGGPNCRRTDGAWPRNDYLFGTDPAPGLLYEKVKCKLTLVCVSQSTLMVFPGSVWPVWGEESPRFPLAGQHLARGKIFVAL
jgi:hypothetical protein